LDNIFYKFNKLEFFLIVRPDGLGSIGIHVEQSGGRKLIFRQPSNGLGVNAKKRVFSNITFIWGMVQADSFCLLSFLNLTIIFPVLPVPH
jgi:hypothetical protein